MTRYRLVTLEEAKEHLSILDEDTDDDARIDRLVVRASQTVLAYCNVNLGDWTDTNGVPLVDSDGNPLRVDALGHLNTAGDFVYDEDTAGDPLDTGISIIPGAVQAATLLVIGAMDDDREGAKDPFGPAAMALLWAYHDPVFA